MVLTQRFIVGKTNQITYLISNFDGENCDIDEVTGISEDVLLQQGRELCN